LFGTLVGPVCDGVRWLAVQLFPDVISQLPDVVMKLEPRIAWWSIITSLVISIGVGVIFGLYPAQRAAYMDPIEALRHE
jgi:putative ABC transport system permease protein